MTLKRILLTLPVLVALILSLSLHAPSRLLAGMVPAGLGVERWGGTLADGQVSGHFRQQPFYLGWTLELPALLTMSLQARVHVRGPLEADLVFQKRLLSWSAQVSQVSFQPAASAWLGPGMQLTRWQGGPLLLSRHGDGVWHEASGDLRTPGGPMQLSIQGQVHALTLPPSRISLAVEEDALRVSLMQNDRQPLASVRLSADRRIEWQLRDRLLRLKPGFVSQNDPDLVVLKVSEPL